jgi:DNA polymerase
MHTFGEGRKKIMLVGEAPGREEDLSGEPFIGSSGQLLRSCLKSMGFDFERDFWTRNAVSCRPPRNATPTRKEISLCYPRLMHEIENLRPRLVICLGKIAAISMLSPYINNITTARFRGCLIPLSEYSVGITAHPAAILRLNAPENDFLYNVFKKDLASFLK